MNAADAFVDPMERLARKLPPAAMPAVVTPAVTPAAAAPATNPVSFIDKHAAELDAKVVESRNVTLPTIARFGWTVDDVRDLKAGLDIQVVDGESYADGWSILKRLRGRKRAVTDFYENLKKPYNLLRGIILDLQGRDEGALKTVDDNLFAKLDVFDKAEQARIAAETKRQQDEADRLAQEEQRQAAAALAAVAEQEPNPSIAQALAKEAAAIAAVPVVAERVVVASRLPQIRGGFFVAKPWTGKVTNKLQFLKLVVTGKVPLEAVEIKQTWIDAQANSLKENLAKVYPGLAAVDPGRRAGTR